MSSTSRSQQRFRDQEIAIARLMDECQALRDENADLLAQLEIGAQPVGSPRATSGSRRPCGSGPAAPATARAALTRWLSGHVPVEVLEDARLLASELVTNSLRHPEIPRTPRCGSRSSSGRARCGSRCAIPARTASVAPREPDRERGGGFGLQLVDQHRHALGRQPDWRDAGVVRGRRGGRDGLASANVTSRPRSSSQSFSRTARTAVPQRQRRNVVEDRVLVVRALEVVVRDPRVEVVDVVQPDVAGEELEQLRELEVRAALERGLGEAPVVAALPVGVLELVLHVEEEDAGRAADQERRRLDEQVRAASRSARSARPTTTRGRCSCRGCCAGSAASHRAGDDPRLEDERVERAEAEHHERVAEQAVAQPSRAGASR